MNIENIQALIAQGLLTDVASLDLTTTYVTVGVYQPGNRQNGPSGNAYPSYVLPLSQLAGTTYTASNGIALVGNDFQLSSILISQFTNDSGYLVSADLTGYVQGVGTIGYLPRWDLTDTLGNSIIFDDGLGHVGIGTAVPSHTFEVNGTLKVVTGNHVLRDLVGVPSFGAMYMNVTPGVSNYVLASNGTTLVVNGPSEINFAVNNSSKAIMDTNKFNVLQPMSVGSIIPSGAQQFVVGGLTYIQGTGSTSATYALKVDNLANSPLLYVNNAGNIGIGIAPTLADVKLEVKVATNQRFIFRNFTYPTIGAALTLQAINDATTDVVNVVTLGLDWYHASRNNLFSDMANPIVPTAKVHIIGNNQGSNLYALKVDNLGLNPLFYVRNDGNVGIGTITPTAKLDVNGQVVAGLGGGVVTSNDSPFYAVRANTGAPNFYSGFQYVFEVGGGVWGIGMSYVNNEFQFLTNGGSTAKFIYGDGNSAAPNSKFVMDLNGGFFGANIASPTANIHAKGIDSTSSNYALKVDNVATNLLSIANNGMAYFRSILDGTGSGIDNYSFTSTTGGVKTSIYSQTGSTSTYNYFTNNVLGTQVSEFLGYHKTSVKNRWSVESLTTGNLHLWIDGSNGYIGIGNVGFPTPFFAPTSQLHVKSTNGYNQLRLETSYTPTSSADVNGNIGDIAWDDSFIYTKVSTGWKRASLIAF